MTAVLFADPGPGVPGADIDPPRLRDERKTRVTASFEAVISMWEEQPRCEIDTGARRQCPRNALWRADFHGCSRGLMCTEHMQTWTQKVSSSFSGGAAPCKWCGQVFASAVDALTVVAL